MIRTTKPDERPAFQFYPGDYLRDDALKLCSLAAQGLWQRIYSYMFSSRERGVLRLPNGVVATDPDLIADLVDVSRREDIRPLLEELRSNEVFSVREEDGAIYSRRMVRDEESRKQKIEAGSRGGYEKARHAGQQSPSRPPSRPLADVLAEGQQKGQQVPSRPLADVLAEGQQKGGSSSSSSTSTLTSPLPPAPIPRDGVRDACVTDWGGVKGEIYLRVVETAPAEWHSLLNESAEKGKLIRRQPKIVLAHVLDIAKGREKPASARQALDWLQARCFEGRVPSDSSLDEAARLLARLKPKAESDDADRRAEIQRQKVELQEKARKTA